MLIGLALWLLRVGKTSTAFPQKGFHHLCVSILRKRNLNSSTLIAAGFHSYSIGPRSICKSLAREMWLQRQTNHGGSRNAYQGVNHQDQYKTKIKKVVTVQVLKSMARIRCFFTAQMYEFCGWEQGTKSSYMVSKNGVIASRLTKWFRDHLKFNFKERRSWWLEATEVGSLI